jgi:hypothetical protein
VVRGDRQPVVTREQALEMRESYRRFGPSPVTLAARYGISVTTVHRVLSGRHPSTAGLGKLTRGRIGVRYNLYRGEEPL